MACRWYVASTASTMENYLISFCNKSNEKSFTPEGLKNTVTKAMTIEEIKTTITDFKMVLQML
jgi:hypothetical protein